MNLCDFVSASSRRTSNESTQSLSLASSYSHPSPKHMNKSSVTQRRTSYDQQKSINCDSESVGPRSQSLVNITRGYHRHWPEQQDCLNDIQETSPISSSQGIRRNSLENNHKVCMFYFWSRCGR